MEAALVVHLVAPEAPAVGAGWDAPDGSVRHVAASWREMPPSVADADVVIAHGVPALVVAQLIADAGPHLVYRPTPASKLRRKRGRHLHASWVAAPDQRTGRRAAKALGLDKDRVVPVRDAERDDWNALVLTVLQSDVPATPDDLIPGTTRKLVEGSSRTTKWILSRFAPSGSAPEKALPPPPAPLPAPDDAAASEPATVAFPGGRLPDPEPFHAEPGPMLPNIIAASRGSRPARLDVGVADPSSPGQPWWRYRRMELPEHELDSPEATRGPPVAHSNGGAWPPPTPSGPARPDAAAAPPANSGSGRSGSPPATGERTPDPDSEPDPEAEARRGLQASVAEPGVRFFVLGAAIIGAVVICAQTGKVGEAPYLIPIGGFFLTLAAARRITRNHPAEPWVGRWLILGFFAKLVAAYIRYYTLTVTYNGVGDASADYDRNGRELASHWLHGTRKPFLADLRETNFIRWFTGVVYYIFGSSLLAATFVFALLALIGSYFWYRATVEAVPMIDKRLYLGFVLFAPSILFWPALVGKEALMQLALGTFALGTAFMMRQRLFPGLAVGIAGGWLMWVVRPHLLAIVTIGAGAAYLAGRVRVDGTKKPGLLSRPTGIIVVAFLIAFTVGQGAKSLGLKDLSLSSVQTELDATTKGSAQGGSQFKSGKNSLSPLNLPLDVVTVFFRPFPWEIDGSLQIFAALESMILAGLVVVRFRSLRIAFARSRETPFLMMCWVLTALYAVAFSAFANFGLLVRQRSLVFAALLVLFSIDPELERKRVEALPEPESETAMVGANAR